jgi:rare lipoprotein A (peptidoglycan hydrolase)
MGISTGRRNAGAQALALMTALAAGTTPASPALADTAIGHWDTVVLAGPSSEGRRNGARRLAKTTITGSIHATDGLASFYWQGQKTASGEAFNKRDLTAAHRTLPFGTRVRVTRLDTGQSVVVRINDRGPFKTGRVIDLSERAAEDIEMTGRGLVGVKLDVLDRR